MFSKWKKESRAQVEAQAVLDIMEPSWGWAGISRRMVGCDTVSWEYSEREEESYEEEPYVQKGDPTLNSVLHTLQVTCFSGLCWSTGLLSTCWSCCGPHQAVWELPGPCVPCLETGESEAPLYIHWPRRHHCSQS